MKFSSIEIVFLLVIEFAWCVKCFNEFKYLSNLHCYFFQILTFISIAIRVKVLSWNNNRADTFQLLIKAFKTSPKWLSYSVNEFQYCCVAILLLHWLIRFSMWACPFDILIIILAPTFDRENQCSDGWSLKLDVCYFSPPLNYALNFQKTCCWLNYKVSTSLIF